MRAQRFRFPEGILPQTAVILVMLVSSVVSTVAQTAEMKEGGQPLLLYPSTVPQGAWWTSLGFAATAPPTEITEAMQVRWPAFDYHTLYGLPNGFFLDGRAAVQVLQNRISAGPRWTSNLGPVSFALGYDLAYWFGFLDVGGFDSKAHGWQGSPSVSLGYDLGRGIAASVKGELMMDYSMSSSQGDLEIGRNSRTLTGYAMTIGLEQPFYHGHYLSLSFRAMYTKFYWQTWSLYSTFDRYLFFPEIAVGFIL